MFDVLYMLACEAPTFQFFCFTSVWGSSEIKFAIVYLLTNLDIFPCTCCGSPNSKLIKLFKMKEETN